ncbi:MAG: copper amine oxidase N-terminal domain-containing protein [candidate division WS1 bacterium]|nr:copper amine oxidase N-terminal domain-containing protein [candidate division WS1 bacterium]
MNRLRLTVSISGILLCFAAGQMATADSTVREWVVEDERLLVGVRDVAQWLGMQVAWSRPTRSVALSDARRRVVLQVDLPRAWVNGIERPLDVPPRLIEGRVYVPLRFLVEALGAEVEYHKSYLELRGTDGRTRKVNLR